MKTFWAKSSEGDLTTLSHLRSRIYAEVLIIENRAESHSTKTRQIIDSILQRIQDAQSATEIHQIEYTLVTITPASILEQKIVDTASEYPEFESFLRIKESDGSLSHLNIDVLRQAYINMLSDVYKKESTKNELNHLKSRYWIKLLITFGFTFLLFSSAIIVLISGHGFGFGHLFANDDVRGFFRLFIIVAVSGLFGASFALIVASHSLYKIDDKDKFKQSQSLPAIGMRLALGTSGSVIFYFLYNTGLFQSDLLPNIAEINYSEVEQGNLNQITIVNKELGKLFVWSFLAGFSGNLAPQTLGTVESGLSRQKTRTSDAPQ